MTVNAHFEDGVFFHKKRSGLRYKQRAFIYIAVVIVHVRTATSLLDWFTNARITSFFFFEALSCPMCTPWTKLVYNWWSAERPATTGIALARSLRSPGYPDSDTMRCVSRRLCDTRALCSVLFGVLPPFFLLSFLLIGVFFCFPISRLAICQRFGCLHAAITERMAKGMLEALTHRSTPR